jgi:hypothetical protein
VKESLDSESGSDAGHANVLCGELEGNEVILVSISMHIYKCGNLSTLMKSEFIYTTKLFSYDDEGNK